MNRSPRGRRAVLAALATCLALVLAAAITTAPAAARFQRESFTAFQQQLSAGQIQSATFNKRAHTLHLTLSDGRLMLVSYPSHEEPQLAALLRAKGVTVTVQKSKKPAAKAVHHTLRYIAGGIVVIVILVVVAVLLVDRRRKLGEQAAGPSPPGPSPPGPSPADPPVQPTGGSE
jgi:ATP-dependent Zn protease